MVVPRLQPSVVFPKEEKKEQRSVVGNVGKVEIRAGGGNRRVLAGFGSGRSEAKKGGRICDAFWFDCIGMMQTRTSILDSWAGSESASKRWYRCSLIYRKSSITHIGYFLSFPSPIDTASTRRPSSHCPIPNPTAFPLSSHVHSHSDLTPYLLKSKGSMIASIIHLPKQNKQIISSPSTSSHPPPRPHRPRSPHRCPRPRRHPHRPTRTIPPLPSPRGRARR